MGKPVSRWLDQLKAGTLGATNVVAIGTKDGRG
jgi:hypothetical protein